MSGFQVDGRLLIFRFATEDAILPVHYGEAATQQMRQLSLQAPLGLLFVLGDDARAVSPQVITYWLEQVRDPQITMAAMAVVTQRLAVRIAVQAFAQATAVFGARLQTRHFPDEPQARSWLQESLIAARETAAR